MVEKEFLVIIQKISDEMGKDIFLEAKKFKSLLLDYTKNEFKKECSLLTAILDTDSVNFINRAENLVDCKQFLVKQLEDDHSLSTQKSAEMLDLLFLVLRGEEIHAPAPVSTPAQPITASQAKGTYYCVQSWQKYHADGNYSEGEDVLKEQQGDVIPEYSQYINHPDFKSSEYFSTYEEARAKLDLLLKSYRDYGTHARIKLRDEVMGETTTYDGVEVQIQENENCHKQSEEKIRKAEKTVNESGKTYYCVKSWQNYSDNPPTGEDVLKEEQGNVIPKDSRSSASEYPYFYSNEYFSTYEEARAKLELIAASYRQIDGSRSIVVRDAVKGGRPLFP